MLDIVLKAENSLIKVLFTHLLSDMPTSTRSTKLSRALPRAEQCFKRMHRSPSVSDSSCVNHSTDNASTSKSMLTCVQFASCTHLHAAYRCVYNRLTCLWIHSPLICQTQVMDEKHALTCVRLSASPNVSVCDKCYKTCMMTYSSSSKSYICS